MSNAVNIKIAYEDLRSLAFGGISGVYALVGTLFEHPVRMIIITNTTNENLILSYNGIDDNSIIVSASARVLDYGSNHAIAGSVLEQPVFQGVWVKSESVNPTNGNIYVEVIYAASR